MTFRNSNSGGVRVSALTLIELLVVLSIIAVLSTVALRSVVGVLDEKNYDANLSQLEELEKAILGDGDSAGFLGDIGRLPQVLLDDDGFPTLAELWDQNGLLDYAIRTPDGDSEVRIASGWRGPYLNLGINRDDITDGFARPYDFYQPNGSPADDLGETIGIVQSLGLSGGAGGTGYEEDLETIFEAENSAATAGIVAAVDVGDFWRETVMIHLRRSDDSEFTSSQGRFLIIRAYGSVNGIAGTSVQEPIDLNSSQNHLPIDDGTGEAPTLVISMLVPQGAKAFRAYQINSPSEPGDDVEIIDDADVPTPQQVVASRRSAIRYLSIDGSIADPITLTLQEGP